MTMTVVEYNERKARLERMKARFFELDAAIDAREGQISAEQASAFAFNDIRQPMTDATTVATGGPAFTEGASNAEQAIGTQGMAELADRDPATIGQDDSIEGIFAQVNAELARGQGGSAPAASTASRVSDPLTQIEPPAAQLNPGGDKPLMQSVDESLKAGGAALAESVTMGAITLSERDKKLIEKSPIAGFVGSLIGDVPGIVGSIGAAKLTAVGFKQILPQILKHWDEGGELIGRTIVNAAAREGLGGAYWSTIKQAVEEIKNSEEQRSWNERLTRLATDVGMFAIPGAAVEGAMAGRAAGKIAKEIQATDTPTSLDLTETGTDATSVPTVKESVGIPEPRAQHAAPLREEPTAEQLAKLQDKFKPMDKVVEEGKVPAADTRARQAVPLRDETVVGEPVVEIVEAWKPKQYEYAAHVKEGHGRDARATVFGEVLDVSEDGATVTFKPRKGNPVTVKASELREPESIPRTADDIDQVLEAAANKRRIAEEGSPLRKQAAEEFKPIEEAVDDVATVGGAEVGAPNVKGSFKRKVVDKASGLEAEAKARIKKRLDEGGKLFDVVGASGEALANIGDLSIIGAAKIAKGAVKFADWSAEMVKEFGDAIKPHLEKIYKKATEDYHRNRAQTTVDEHLAYMQDISQPFEFRPRTVKTEGGFRTGYQRFRDIKQQLREQKTGQKLKGAALEESLIDDELRTFTEDAWKAGAPVMRTKQGTLIPVFDSKADAERIWDYVYGQAKAKLSKVPKADEVEITREARKQFLQEMVNRGVALKRKRTPVQLSPDVKRKTDLSLYIILKADMGAEKLKAALAGIPEGDLFARQAKLTELGMERGLLSPAVRAQGTFVPLDFAGYSAFKDVAGETLDPTRLIQAIDGALSVAQKRGIPGQAGPAERYVLWRTRDMLKQKMAWYADMEAVGKKVLGGLNKKDREIVSDVLEQLATSEADDLSVKGMLQRSEFRDITTDEKILQAALDLRPIYDEVLDMQNVLRTQRSQKAIPKRTFYSPRKQKEVSAFQELLGREADPANLLSTGSMIPDFVIPNKPRIGHDLERTLLEPKWALEKDALVLLQKYLNAAGKDIFDTSIIQNAKAFMDQLEVMGFGKSAVGLRDWVGQSFAGAPHKFDKVMTEVLNSAFGDVVSKNWQKWSGQFRGALARSVFPLNISWNLFLQTSSGALTTTRYGMKASAKGMRRWIMEPQFREDIAENAYSAIVKSQKSGRISQQDFNQGMSRAIALEKKPLETATDAANFIGEWIERHMTGWSIATGYEDGAAKGLTGRALWEYASDAGAKTQSMYNKEDLPGLLRSAGVKTIAPFQTFAFEMWNTIQEVAGRVGTPPSTKQERIKTILRFMAGATAVNMISAEYSGRKPWEIGSYIPFYPMFAKPIEATIKGENADQAATRGLPSPVGIAMSFGQAVDDVLRDNDWRKMRQWAIRYGTAGLTPIPGVALPVGIPGGTELARLYDAIEAISRGGKFDKNDKLQFPITGTEEQIRALIGGTYSTEAGQKKLEGQTKGVIEIEGATTPAGKVGQATAEALPIVGDVVEFNKKPEATVEIVPDQEPNPSRRRLKPRRR